MDSTGLHFPASDIPPQARALYKINRIRVLYDRDAETARLVVPTTVHSRDEVANKVDRSAARSRTLRYLWI